MLLQLQLQLIYDQQSVGQSVLVSGARLGPVTNFSFSLKLKLKLIYDRQSVGQSVLVSGTHLGPVTNFSFSLKFPLDSCGFIL
jgi:hypothetical protein